MKCLLIYNQISGKGKFKSEIPELEELIKNSNHTVDFCFPETKEEAEGKSISLSGDYDCYIVVGGDGTLNSVINGLMSVSKRPKILVIPRGTTNDMARILGMKKDLKQNIALLDEEPIKMDIGQINDRFFSYAIACGSFSDVSYVAPRKTVRKYGYFAYLKYVVRKVGKNKKIPIKVKHDIGEVEGSYCIALLLNARRVAGFNLRFYSEGKMDDGILEMRLIQSFGILNMIKVFFFFLLLGRVRRSDVQLISSEFEVEAPESLTWNIDGEKGPNGSVFIRVHNKAIEFFATEKSKKKNFLPKK